MSKVFGKRQPTVPLEGQRPSRFKKIPHKTTPSPPRQTAIAETIVNTEDCRPYIEVWVFGQQMKGLLDSGAAVTVIRYNMLIDGHKEKIKETSMKLTAANNGTLEVIGKLEVPFKFRGRYAWMETIVVAEMAQDLILGYDFWQVMDIKIVGAVGDLLSIAMAPTKTEILLENDMQKQLDAVVDVFLKSTPTFLGRTDAIMHEIELTEDAKPFIRKSHYYSPAMQEKIHVELDFMLKMGVVKESSSPVASPIVPVSKSDGNVRLCLDSRRLNAMTKRDQFPLPNPNHIFARMERANYFSIIDLSKAYWQIPLSNKKIPGQFATAQELTAFVVPGRGLFQFAVMPFGLSNAPATQCRLMQQILGHDLENKCFVYMDDILLATTTTTEMIGLIKTVATRLKEAKLSINFEKSRFFAKSVRYLGYIIGKEGIAADPERLEVMKEFPVPKNQKAVRRFLGLCSYYRRLICNFSGIAAPMTNLLKNGIKFVWQEEHQRAFEALKNAMCEAPVVKNPDFGKNFYIQCDASDAAGAAALGQIQNGVEVIIAYYSHKWNVTEAKWGATEREAAVVLYAIRHFRDYVWGRPLLIITDAQALVHVKTLKTEGSSRLARWALELNHYDLTIRHRAGKASVVPDALSRAVEEILVIEDEETDEWYEMMREKILHDPESCADFKLQGRRLFKYELVEEDIGCQGYVWKEYVPQDQRISVVTEIHRQLCHLGWQKCLGVVRKKFFWPRITKEVEKVVRSCDTCKATKSTVRNTRVPLGMPRSADAPFKMLALDHWGGTTKSRKGNTHLLLVLDIFSKYVFLHPVKDTSAELVVNFLESEVFLKFGVPRILLSDNHRPLIGRKMAELLNKYGVTHGTIPAYHAQANPSERYLKTVSAAIRALVLEKRDQRAWDEGLPQIQYALNTTMNLSTQKSPFMVNFGRDEHQTEESPASTRNQLETDELLMRFQQLREQVKQNLHKAQQKYRHQYDRSTKLLSFGINERAWRKNRELSNAAEHFSQKLAPRYIACRILECLGRDTYKVKDEESPEREWRVHANDLLKDYV